MDAGAFVKGVGISDAGDLKLVCFFFPALLDILDL